MKIPKTFRFPGGPLIKIRLLTKKQIQHQVGEAIAFYLHTSRIIGILKTLSLTEQYQALAHEIGHAWVDWFEETKDVAAT